MNTLNKIRMKVFGCKWEYIGKQRLWGEGNVPKWVHKKTGGLNPGTIGTFKGKHYIYKVIRLDTATNYGQTPAKFYRRLRCSTWKKMQGRK